MHSSLMEWDPSSLILSLTSLVIDIKNIRHVLYPSLISIFLVVSLSSSIHQTIVFVNLAHLIKR